MGVSRGSVREAMKILTAFGLVDIRVGNGTYICDTPGTKLMDSLLFSFFIANPDTKNLYELDVYKRQGLPSASASRSMVLRS